MVWVVLLLKVLCMLVILENSMKIEDIRNSVYQNVGNYVEVVQNEGRNKTSYYKGKVVEVYHNIFIVLDCAGKKCFSYYDILTKTIKISFKM